MIKEQRARAPTSTYWKDTQWLASEVPSHLAADVRHGGDPSALDTYIVCYKTSVSRTPSLTPTFGLQLRSFLLFPYSLLSFPFSFVLRSRTPRLLYWRLLSRARI